MKVLSIVRFKPKPNHMGYVPWPTPCDVAEEIKRMAKCEHLAAESRGEANFDWAERSLKQKRDIPDHEKLVNWAWRQWCLSPLCLPIDFWFL